MKSRSVPAAAVARKGVVPFRQSRIALEHALAICARPEKEGEKQTMKNTALTQAKLGRQTCVPEQHVIEEEQKTILLARHTQRNL